MNTVSELVANARKRESPLIHIAGRRTPYTSREFCTNCWKAGNLLGHYGVHPGSDVAVVFGPKLDSSGVGCDDETPTTEGTINSADPLLAVIGATLIRARANLTPETPVDARALVRPAGDGWAGQYPTTARCSQLAYGEPSTQPSVVHFEAKLWSQNPTQPPEAVSPEMPALSANANTYRHGQLLTATEHVIEEWALDSSARIAFPADPTNPDTLLADFREPGAVVAGVLVPLYCGGTVTIGSTDEATLTVGDGTDTDVSVQDLTAAIV